MNFGLASLRELIEDFLTNSGGRRGRQREQRREESDEFDGEPEAESATDGQSRETESGSHDGTSESEPESTESDSGDGGSRSGGGFFGRGSSDDEGDIDDLFYRIEELEEELQDKETELGSVQDSQQHVAEQVEEMNDRVQRLLGVYDQVTDDVNPFTGEGEAQNGFGVFGEDEKRRDGSSSAPGIESRLAADSTASDETVSFDDLKGVIEDAAATQSSGGERIAFDEDDVDENDTRVEVQATESVDEPETTSDAAGTDAGVGTDSSDADDSEDDPDDATLSTLADTYATDIIVFEWLTRLVRTGGSAATLRAISYYAEIGWIGEDVKTHLEDVLSGPDLGMHVDPGSTPEELTAEDHADSYTYIMKLREIHETKAEVQPDPDRAPESEVGP